MGLFRILQARRQRRHEAALNILAAMAAGDEERLRAAVKAAPNRTVQGVISLMAIRDFHDRICGTGTSF